MKHRYVYIDAPRVSMELQVFSVYLGKSLRERQLIERVQLLKRFDPNIYFERYSLTVLDFLSNLALTLRPADEDAHVFFSVNHQWIDPKTFASILPKNRHANQSYVKNPK